MVCLVGLADSVTSHRYLSLSAMICCAFDKIQLPQRDALSAPSAIVSIDHFQKLVLFLVVPLPESKRQKINVYRLDLSQRHRLTLCSVMRKKRRTVWL